MKKQEGEETDIDTLTSLSISPSCPIFSFCLPFLFHFLTSFSISLFSLLFHFAFVHSFLFVFTYTLLSLLFCFLSFISFFLLFFPEHHPLNSFTVVVFLLQLPFLLSLLFFNILVILNLHLS